MVLAQLSLRPIHVIRSGLTRLGQGEFGVVVDLPQRDEFGELGDFFNTVSARLSADRPPPAPALLGSGLDAGKDPLEDAVAIFDADVEAAVRQPGHARDPASGPARSGGEAGARSVYGRASVPKGRRRGGGDPPVARPDLGVSPEPRDRSRWTSTACRRRANG